MTTALRRSIAMLTLLVGSTALLAADAPKAEPNSPAETKKTPAWSFTPDPKLPNVLILGDSISIGYTLQVRELMKGKANVFRPLNAAGNGSENCNGTTYGVKRIDHWLEGHKWDVIHFNFGLHDLKHVKAPGDNTISKDLNDPPQATPEQYGKNLEEIVKKLKATNAKLIFATTTPVPAGATGRTPEQPAIYNAIALKIMKANDIPVDDLYAFVEPKLADYQLPKDVHYKPAGYKALAEQVVAAVEKGK